MTPPITAKWAIHYEDSPDQSQISVSYDTTSKYLPNCITVEGSSSDFSVYIDLEHAEWVAARILDAAAAIRKRSK